MTGMPLASAVATDGGIAGTVLGEDDEHAPLGDEVLDVAGLLLGEESASAEM